MSFVTTVQDDSITISLPARFDFRRMRDFHSAIEGVIEKSPGDQIVVDFAATEYVDSSTLGVLLVMRDRARGSGKSVVLAGARGAVRETLKIANFEKLFAIR